MILVTKKCKVIVGVQSLLLSYSYCSSNFVIAKVVTLNLFGRDQTICKIFTKNKAKKLGATTFAITLLREINE